MSKKSKATQIPAIIRMSIIEVLQHLRGDRHMAIVPVRGDSMSLLEEALFHIRWACCPSAWKVVDHVDITPRSWAGDVVLEEARLTVWFPQVRLDLHVEMETGPDGSRVYNLIDAAVRITATGDNPGEVRIVSHAPTILDNGHLHALYGGRGGIK